MYCPTANTISTPTEASPAARSLPAKLQPLPPRTDIDMKLQRATVDQYKKERLQRIQQHDCLHCTTQLFPPVARVKLLVASVAEARRLHQQLGGRSASRLNLSDAKVFSCVVKDIKILMKPSPLPQNSSLQGLSSLELAQHRYDHTVQELSQLRLWDFEA